MMVNCGDKENKTYTNDLPTINVTVESPSNKNKGVYFSASGQIETEQYAGYMLKLVIRLKKDNF